MNEFNRLAIPEVIEITPRKFTDSRGFFSETFKRSQLEEQGIRVDWLQDNHSFSEHRGTVRGLHFQMAPFAQDKLIRVLSGAIFDVAVDLRPESPTFGKWVGVELSHARWNQLYVPTGFAHGFITLEPNTEVLYKVSAPYSKEHEGAVLWNDPDLAIVWPETDKIILSDKDEIAPTLREQFSMDLISGRQ